MGIVVSLSMYLAKDMLANEERAPLLSLPLLSQQGLSPATLQWQARDKTLIYFFAPWCTVCSVSMPGLTLLPESEAQVVAVALDWQSTEEVQQFIDRVGFEGTVLLGTDQVKSAYKIDAYPSYYVVDNKGNVIHRDRGFSTPPGLWLRLNYGG